jgi:hypothetical protein
MTPSFGRGKDACPGQSSRRPVADQPDPADATGGHGAQEADRAASDHAVRPGIVEICSTSTSSPAATAWTVSVCKRLLHDEVVGQESAYGREVTVAPGAAGPLRRFDVRRHERDVVGS